MSFLPDPLLDNLKEHYKDFHELCGKVTTENDCPSLKFPLLSTEKDKVARQGIACFSESSLSYQIHQLFGSKMHLCGFRIR